MQSNGPSDYQEALDELCRLRAEQDRYLELFDATPEPYLLTDARGVIRQLNHAATILLHGDRQSLVGSTLTAFIAGGDTADFLQRLGRLLDEEGDRITNLELEITPARGRPLEVSATMTAVRDPDGVLVGLRWLLHNIDKYRQSEAVLREQTEFVINLYEALAHPFYVVQADDYTVRMANSAAFPEQLPDKLTCYALTHRRDSPCTGDIVCPLEEVRRTKRPAVVEHVHYDQNGDPRLYEVHGYPTIDEDGNVIQMIGYALDITERRRTEEALEESEERYSILFNNSHSVMLLVDPDTGKIVDANRAACTYYGYPWAELTARRITDLTADGDDQAVRQMHRAEAQKERPLNFQHRLASGEIRDIELYWDPIRLHGRKLLYSIIHDVTERKRAEEATRRQSRELALINRVSQALTSTLELDEVLVTVLEEACRLLDTVAGLVWLVEPDTNELVCRHAIGLVGDGCAGRREVPAQAGCAGTVVLTGKSLIVPDMAEDPQCTEWPTQVGDSALRCVVAVPLRVKQRVIGVLEIADRRPNRFSTRDLTLIESLAATAAIAIENARLYTEARQSAETRAVLLSEVNHRVKNNLSTIIGLLYAERRRIEGTDEGSYQGMMKDLTNRVHGLARVHSMLSSSEWAPLLLSDLASEIIHSALASFSLAQRVSVEVDESPVRVNPDQAHDLALVINELTTNALKYAADSEDAVQIAVRLMAEANDMVSLEFRDNGPGYPDDVLTLERHSVGFDLIRNIVRKGLRGELWLRNDHGAVALVRFRADPELIIVRPGRKRVAIR
jgi:PAS domain S-box-containing protein